MPRLIRWGLLRLGSTIRDVAPETYHGVANPAESKDVVLMSARRNVKQNASGSWDVLREGDRRGAVSADTERAAISRAREQVRREGGGEVRVVDRTGKIVSARTVPAVKRAPKRARQRAA